MNFYLILLSTQTFLGLYLGWRFRWAFAALLPSWLTAPYVYWPLVALIVMSFPLTHFLGRRLGAEFPPWLLFATALVFGILLMSFTTVLITDLVALFARFLPFLRATSSYFHLHPHHMGFLVLSAITLQVAHGLYHAYTPRLTHYAVKIDKPLKSGAAQLRIVQISDLHIGRFSSVAMMKALVAQVNALNADLIVITGDIVDNSIKPYFEDGMPDIFSGLRSRYGVYAIMGNHEYYGESPQLDIDAYRQSRMQVLRDEVHYLKDPGITLIGRDDWGIDHLRLPPGVLADHSTPMSRTPLATLAARADAATPLILLDHQPREIDDAVAQKIDLQFSGHTHNGQFFPFNLVVNRLYKKAWGLLEEGPYTLIVSCGFGTWGPPLRMPSYSEIVVADVKFRAAP